MLKKWAIASLCCLFLFGCRPEVVSEGGTRNPDFALSIISLSPSTTEIIGGAGGITAIAGRTIECDYPPGIAQIEVVQNGIELNMERILAKNPDLIVYDKALYSDEEIKQLEATGANTLAQDVHSVEDFRQFLVEVSQATGQETRISKYFDQFQRRLVASRASIRNLPSKPKVMVMLGSDGNYMASGTDSFLADLFVQMGCDYVGPDTDKFVPVTIEQVIQFNPDIVICPGSSEKAIEDDSKFSIADFHKQGGVIGIEDDYLLRVGFRFDRTIPAMEKQISDHMKKRGDN